MSLNRRKRHSPEQIVRKVRDADAMLNSGKELSAVLQALEVSESTLERWRKQYGGMKSEEAVRLKKLEEENRRVDHRWLSTLEPSANTICRRGSLAFQSTKPPNHQSTILTPSGVIEARREAND